MTTPNDLSDKALAVFAFAIYHQLDGGDAIAAVATNDGAGRQADPEAISELKQQGLADVKEGKIVFTAAGSLMLSQLIDRLRGHW